MFSFNLVLPEMNDLITSLGGENYKGWIIGLFTISSAIARPFSAKISDFVGRKQTLYLGILFAMIITLTYPFAFSVSFLLLLRFLHGFSAGFFPTGGTALVTDILPENKRGSGMGIWGTFISLGIGAGQGFSTSSVKLLGINGMFALSGAFLLISFAITLFQKETLEKRIPFTFKIFKIQWKDIFEPTVLPVSMVIFLSAMCSGMVFVLSPDMSEFLGIENKGAFFVSYMCCTIFVRLFVGFISNRFERRKFLLLAMSVLAISMVLLWNSKTAGMYYFSSIIFGLATGIGSPNLFAWTADLSPKDRRGAGAGTMFIALEFGILSGSLIANLFYRNTFESLRFVFFIGFFCAISSCIYLIWHMKTKRS